MLHRFLLVLIVVITLFSLVSVVTMLGISITGSTIKAFDDSITGISFIIAGLIIFTIVVLIIDSLRIKKNKI